jgi:hypothetical protein
LMGWARLLKRVFDIDMQHCPNCGSGELKTIAVILDRPVIEKILTHLGLDPQPRPRERAREAGHGFPAWVALAGSTCLAGSVQRETGGTQPSHFMRPAAARSSGLPWALPLLRAAKNLMLPTRAVSVMRVNRVKGAHHPAVGLPYVRQRPGWRAWRAVLIPGDFPTKA